MSYINERAAYIRGLADGLGVDGKTPEQRVIREILALLEEAGSQADREGEKQQKQFTALATRINSLQAELTELQNDLYEDEDPELDSPEALGRALGVIPVVNPASKEPQRYVHCPHCGEVFPEGTGPPPPVCPHCGHNFTR